ncbi:MAG: hypothetical protein AB7H96_12655 [Vicinamibacterales bacterium]
MKVVVNGVEATPGRPVQNWGELLTLIDDECAGQGVVVTEVSFDGVAQPSFRDPGLAVRSVGDLRIEVDTARQSDLVLSGIGDALRAIEPLRAAASSLAEAFREYDVERGNREMAAFARNLSSLVELTGTIALVTGLETGSLADVSTQVDRLVAARDSGDYVTVADVLEHDLMGVLEQWRSVLAGVHRALLQPPSAM